MFLILRLNFQTYEIVSGKTLFFVIDRFFTPHSVICLNITLAFVKAVLY